MNLWEQIKSLISSKISPEAFQNWLSKTAFLRAEGTKLWVQVPDPVLGGRIRNLDPEFRAFCPEESRLGEPVLEGLRTDFAGDQALDLFPEVHCFVTPTHFMHNFSTRCGNPIIQDVDSGGNRSGGERGQDKNLPPSVCGKVSVAWFPRAKSINFCNYISSAISRLHKTVSTANVRTLGTREVLLSVNVRRAEACSPDLTASQRTRDN